MGLKKRLRSSLISCLMIISLVACSTNVETTEVTPELNIEPISVELGSGLDEKALGIEDLTRVVIDVSDVDFETIGVYEGKAITETSTTTFTIIVKDTTPPELELMGDKVLVLAPEEEVEIDVLAEATDLTGVTLTFEDDTYETEESGVLMFENAGTYKNTIIATDGEGNESSVSVTFLVGVEPEITGVVDIEVVVGEEIDYTEGITAVDGEEQDITESIVVDSEEVDIETVGTYEVSYSVIDENGFSCVETCVVTVIEEEVVEETEEETEEEESTSDNSSSNSSSSNSSSNSSSSNSSSSNSSSSNSSSSNSSSSNSSSSNSSSSNSSSSNSSSSNSSSSNSSSGNSSSSNSSSSDSSSSNSNSSDSGSSNSSSNDSSSNSSSSDSSSSSSSSTSISGDASVISQEALSLVNEERAKQGLSILTYNSSLGTAAKLRAAEQSLLFSHTRPDGSSAVTAYGSGGAFGECLAKGQTSAYAVVSSWKTSSAHWDALMDASYTQAAIAYYVDSSGTMYWCALVTNY